MATAMHPRIGVLLRHWRGSRHFSQLGLSVATGVSTRHLSRIETGLAEPSRDMVLRLAEALDVPLRERNTLLLAAGYAPAWPETDYADERLAPVRRAIDMILERHDPFPAAVVDRHWNLVDANRGLDLLTAEVDPALLEGTVNLARVALHPRGLAPKLVNPAEVRRYLLERVGSQLAASDDRELKALYEEIAGAEVPSEEPPPGPASPVTVPVRIRTARGELSLFSTIATFGAPLDVTVSELAVELFFPADEATAAAFAA